jgi:hypothetical protein
MFLFGFAPVADVRQEVMAARKVLDYLAKIVS